MLLAIRVLADLGRKRLFVTQRGSICGTKKTTALFCCFGSNSRSCRGGLQFEAPVGLLACVGGLVFLARAAVDCRLWFPTQRSDYDQLRRYCVSSSHTLAIDGQSRPST